MIGENTYALVTAAADDGVQIIDITDPSNSKAVASVTDGETYPTLDNPTGIATVKIGDNTYALVASFADSGVQIIDISDPTSPSAVASITDGAAYPELYGPRGITTVVVGTKTYALVAAYNDAGVQIIDISDPASSSAAASLADGETYTTLNGTSGITTVVVGERTYALVAASSDDGVQIIQLEVDPLSNADEILEQSVLLYPNPAKSELKVEYTTPTQTHYTIYAHTGQVMGQSYHREAHHTIRVSHLSTGTYLLQAKSGYDEKYYHFIKE